jgi:hypothetical protein
MKIIETYDDPGFGQPCFWHLTKKYLAAEAAALKASALAETKAKSRVGL